MSTSWNPSSKDIVWPMIWPCFSRATTSLWFCWLLIFCLFDQSATFSGLAIAHWAFRAIAIRIGRIAQCVQILVNMSGRCLVNDFGLSRRCTADRNRCVHCGENPREGLCARRLFSLLICACCGYSQAKKPKQTINDLFKLQWHPAFFARKLWTDRHTRTLLPCRARKLWSVDLLWMIVCWVEKWCWKISMECRFILFLQMWIDTNYFAQISWLVGGCRFSCLVQLCGKQWQGFGQKTSLRVWCNLGSGHALMKARGW